MKKNWKKYAFEFLSIFIAVIAAFALERWSEEAKDRESQLKILSEIQHGLANDLKDVDENVDGHKFGIKACDYWIKILKAPQTAYPQDTAVSYLHLITRDFISVQNTAGYENLKSRGLELIQDDSLRLMIISLYEYEYNIIYKLEERYEEMQYFKNFYPRLREYLFPALVINSNKVSIKLSKEHRRKLTFDLTYIRNNRYFILNNYKTLREKIVKLDQAINEYLLENG